MGRLDHEMRRLVGAAVVTGALLVGGDARAYCRSSTCSGPGIGSTCMATVSSGSCDVDLPLQWPEPCVSFDVAAAASSSYTWAIADAALEKAFVAWTTVDCGGGVHPSIEAFDFGSVACTTVEYNQNGGNANILIFRDTTWPHASVSGADTLALTTVTYDVDSGNIFDADIEVNTVALNEDTSGETNGLIDALTHEAGHFFGLAHSALSGDTQPTMYWQYQAGERVLATDDKQAICAAYPPGRASAGVCSGIPRHGWSPDCLADQTNLSCAAARPGREDGGGMLGVIVAASAGMVVARRRRRLAKR